VNTDQVLFDLLGGNFDLGSFSALDSRRKEVRIPHEPELVRIATADGEHLAVIAQVANLSKSGIGLKLSKQLHLVAGTPLMVAFQWLIITGIVRYSRQSKSGSGPFELGLEISSTERIC